MALQKFIQLPNGATGNYVRLVVAHVDYMVKEATYKFSLYTSQNHRRSNPQEPLVSVYSQFKVNGDRFDRYFGSANMSGMDHVFQGYLAAQSEMPWGVSGQQLLAGDVSVFESGQPYV